MQHQERTAGSTEEGDPSQHCITCSRRSRCIGGLLVEGMSASDIKAVGITRTVLNKGEHLFREGEDAEYLYAIRGGALKTYVVTSEGHEEIRGFQLSDDVAGLDAICQTHFKASAKALSRTWACRLPMVSVRSQMMRSGSFRDRVLARLGHELDRLHGMLHQERCSSEKRVASFLIRQFEAKQSSGSEIELPMSRVDLARFLDMATETVSRVFTRLQARNILRSNGNHCEVLDRDALYTLP